ncbi:MAG: Bifunctional NAD(P)H-hydrate repair enzyme Nnr [Microgenomates bacterium OLB23]|nr:MAG: Bifunctional NAD(P)H-hydrate repair enzyme Nnr [Microgenomates bacterium OLB23]
MVTVSPEHVLHESLQSVKLPGIQSHKGQNGKLLVIGGSSIFHAASIWAAEAASRIVDMVHYSSTEENADIMRSLKTKFTDGIVIRQQDLLDYVAEDDCILIGPGMERGSVSEEVRNSSLTFKEICALPNEAEYTYALLRFLIQHYPHKRFVFDAAALQMIEPQWLLNLKTTPIVTPHSAEFEKLFGTNIVQATLDEKRTFLQGKAKEFNCVILYKQIIDIIAAANSTTVVVGGNAGLTKGGTGDVLAGITAALYTKKRCSSLGCSCILLAKKNSRRHVCYLWNVF